MEDAALPRSNAFARLIVSLKNDLAPQAPFLFTRRTQCFAESWREFA